MLEVDALSKEMEKHEIVHAQEGICDWLDFIRIFIKNV